MGKSEKGDNKNDWGFWLCLSLSVGEKQGFEGE